MTFGEGVSAEEAWPAVLERALDLRVHPAGVPGYARRRCGPAFVASFRRCGPTRGGGAVAALDQQRCAEPFVYKGGYIVAAGYADKLRLIDGNLYLADVRWPVVGTATAGQTALPLARLALPAVRAAAGAVARAVGRRCDGGSSADASGDVAATAATLVGMRGDAAARACRCW